MIFNEKYKTKNKRKGNRKLFIVVHATAGASAESSLLYCERIGISCHYFIERDGTIYKTAEHDDVCFHAGKSNWGGYSGLNDFSVGIELANFGPMSADRKKPLNQNYEWEFINNVEYEKYSEKQLKALKDLCLSIMEELKLDKTKILRHSDISPGRKIDPYLNFPWKAFLERL